jgi:exopolyphosphatase / guanosine-5'-triphosphate,3'-diphosphate pyrophosphatase
MIGDSEAVFANAGPQRAVIDIGSNTVRMVVYGGARRAPTVLLNERVIARLGRDLTGSGRIPKAAIDLALAGVRRFTRILDDLHIRDVDCIATAAPREAKNGAAFLKLVEETGLKPRLLSGDEEARAAAMGVIGAFPGARGAVADLGGGSLELTAIANGETGRETSLPLGTLRLPALRADGADKFKHRIAKYLKTNDWDKPIGGTLYLVGGTWRALACYAMHDQSSPLTDPHGFTLSPAEALTLAKRLRRSKRSILAAVPRVSPMRAAKLPDAGALLQVLLSKLEPHSVVVSAWGLREGVLYDRLDAAARSQDPLLAGIASFAAPRGGPPTLATRIAAWTVDAVPSEGRGSERLRLAATMLALASMQIEPNLRLRQAINWALYKRWLCLDPQERAMIAAALAANCGEIELPKLLQKLAEPDQLEEAMCWGLAIRLCRRLGAGSRRSLRNSALKVEGNRLTLYLGEEHAVLRAEHVEEDLATLADRLGLVPAIEVVPIESLFEAQSFDITSVTGEATPTAQ